VRFRTRLAATYFLMALLPIVALTAIFYYTSLYHVSALTREHVLEIVRKTNAQSDLKLERARESSMKLATSKALHELFANLDPTSELAVIRADREVQKIMGMYFVGTEDIFSHQLVTSYFMFGNSPLQGNAYRSKLYHTAIQENGSFEWIPTYDIADMYNDKAYREIAEEERYYFAAVMQLKGIYLENGVSGAFPPHIEKPVLVVSYKADYFHRLFADSVPIENASYMVLDGSGQIVSHQDISRLGTKPDDPWIHDILRQKSGTANVAIDGKDFIVCFDTSAVTGWTSVVMFPVEALVADIAPTIRNSAYTMAVVMFALSLLLAFILSGQVARPLKKLIAAIRKVGDGDFESRIDLNPENNDEFSVVLAKFNDMNEKVNALIEENYKAKLREQEAEIMALNVQLNPHFLYNTLNIMNWLAIDRDQKELSKMLVSLSNMLHYTTHNHQDTGDLREELEWLRHYLFIMGERFKGKFRVEFEIDEALYRYRVPRLFLQPIIENAILHGFGAITEGGVIHISGQIRDGERWFIIRDNGRGMPEHVARALLEADSEHVGLKNVHKRIQFLYGKDYGLQVKSTPAAGTEVIVRLPCPESAK
jgi:two-component system sensor histidine kinase YesM